MKEVRQRFTLWMSVLATIFGTSVAAWRLQLQDDLVADLVKISAIIALATAVLSYAFWTLLRAKQGRPFRASLAGLLTAALIVPLPFFAHTFKNGLLAQLQNEGAGLFSAALAALPPALWTGYLTYVEMTKASLAALILSAALGFWIARRANI